MEKRMAVVEKTVSILKEKKFEELKEMLNNEIVPFDKDELIPKFKEIEPQFGNIVEFRPYGFNIVPIKDKEILHISEAIMRNKQNNEFSVDIDLNSDKMCYNKTFKQQGIRA